MRRFTERKLLVATHNAGKLEEMRALFAPFGIGVVGAAEMRLTEPDETEASFLGNARIKAQAAMQATGLPVLADDSGITVDGLDGAPGVYTADWAEKPDGTRDYAAAMAKVERLARHARDRRAWFSCALVLACPDGHVESFLGEAHG